MKQQQQIKRILVPVDFSAFSEQAIRTAVEVAQNSNAYLDFLHVVTPVYVGLNDEDLLPEADNFYKGVMMRAESRMKKLFEKHSGNKVINAGFYCSLNIIHRAVNAHAKKHKTDLIIMGTHGTSGFKEMFAGSNAYRVASEAPCAVLTLRKKPAIKGGLLTFPLLDTKDFMNLVQMSVPFISSFKMKTELLVFKDKGAKDLQPGIKKLLHQAKQLLEEASIEVKTSIINGDLVTENILKHCGKVKSKLVVVPSKNSFKIGQLFSGSYAQQFVNHSHLPVLVMP